MAASKIYIFSPSFTRVYGRKVTHGAPSARLSPLSIANFTSGHSGFFSSVSGTAIGPVIHVKNRAHSPHAPTSPHFHTVTLTHAHRSPRSAHASSSLVVSQSGVHGRPRCNIYRYRSRSGIKPCNPPKNQIWSDTEKNWYLSRSGGRGHLSECPGWPSGAPISRGSTASMLAFGGRRGPHRSGSRSRGRPIERREAGSEGRLWPDAASQGRTPDGSGLRA